MTTYPINRLRLIALFSGLLIMPVVAPVLADPAPTAPQRLPIQIIPTRYEQDRFLATPVTASGQPLTFFVDSGGGLGIELTAVKRLGLTEQKLHADGQDFQAVMLPPLSPKASIPSPTLAGKPMPLPVHPQDDSPLGFIIRGTDGTLGQAWLHEHVWTFDYPGRRLLLRSPGDLPHQTPEHTVCLGFQTVAGVRQADYPRIQVAVVGKVLDMLLDTGATTNLTPAALREVHDGRPSVRATSFIVASVFSRWHTQHPDWRVIERAEGWSGEAMIEVPHVTVAGFTVGPVWFTRRPDAALKVDMSQYMDKQIDGSLGGDALRHFRVTLDYPAAVAVFEKPSVHGLAQEQGDAQKAGNAEKAVNTAAVVNSALRAELLAMVKQDQDVRQRLIDGPKNTAISSEAVSIDKKDTARMKQIVAEHGWPDERLVGQDGADAAWLLVQHADADPAFQAQCLPLVQAAAERGTVSKQDLALLTDRVLLAQGKKQVYGTQFTWKTGKVEPRPLEDPAHVDERRKTMGLMPLAEYKGMLIQLYKLQDKK